MCGNKGNLIPLKWNQQARKGALSHTAGCSLHNQLEEGRIIMIREGILHWGISSPAVKKRESHTCPSYNALSTACSQ